MMAFVYARRYLDMLAPSHAHTHVRKHKHAETPPLRPARLLTPPPVPYTYLPMDPRMRTHCFCFRRTTSGRRRCRSSRWPYSCWERWTTLRHSTLTATLSWRQSSISWRHTHSWSPTSSSCPSSFSTSSYVLHPLTSSHHADHVSRWVQLAMEEEIACIQPVHINIKTNKNNYKIIYNFILYMVQYMTLK